MRFATVTHSPPLINEPPPAMNLQNLTANPQPLTAFSPRVRKSPFFAATRRHGCNAFTIYNHTYLPLYYADPVTDYRRLVEHVSLWDVACQRQVEITGRDAARFTQMLTPRNLSAVKAGQCRYVLITDENGGIINDPVLLKLGAAHFWLSLADSDVLLWAKGLAQNAGMEVNITEPEVSPLQVQGPKSPQVIAALFGGAARDLKYFHFMEVEWNGASLLVSRTGWSGERGYEIYLRDAALGDALWEAVMEAGKPFSIGPGAPSHIRRIEGGMLSHGMDSGLDTNPFEMGMERLVDLEQDAAFIGKEALRRIRAEGVRRRFTGVTIDGAPLAANEHHWPVHGNGRAVGKLTSMVHSPRLGQNIGLALLETAHTGPGSRVTIHTDDGPRDATVTALPFYDPQKKLARG